MKEQGEVRQIVVDVETTMKCPIGSNKASPYWPENELVLAGFKPLYGPLTTTHSILRDECLGSIMPSSGVLLFVGHNIGFDLGYFCTKNKIAPKIWPKLQIWDTQLAEYLLSGQQHTYPSLDDTALRRGGKAKDERVSIMFAAGKGADEVPRNMLEDYLKGDLDNTATVFKSQFKEALDSGMLPLLWSQMDARLATIEMTNNGMQMDKEFLVKRSAQLAVELAALKKCLSDDARTISGGFDLDPTKPADLSLLLFGGVHEWQEKEEVGTFKNGKPKFKWVDKKAGVSGFGIVPNSEWKNNNGYSTADGVLEELGTQLVAYMAARTFIKNVQDYRAMSKQLSTYFEGLQELIFPDGKIHQNINHCATRTGRLSQNDPNLQNQTNGEIKKAFVSRWGDDGVIVDADYGQLEIVMLAILSGDQQLMQDIRDGVDIHAALFKSMHGRLPTKDERWSFKRCSFALVYGGGAKAIAAQGGTSFPMAKEFIKVFYGRYPGVKAYHEKLAEEVKARRYYDGDKDKETGLPIGKAKYSSKFSPRVYVFREYVNSAEVEKWKGEKCSFSPTEFKNYPVQGGATGDIVPLVLGKLFRVLKNNPELRDKCLMVNTVHDNVVFDCHKSVLEKAVPIIREVMEAAPKYIESTFGGEFPLQLKVGISFGPNWFEQQELDTNNQLRKAA